MLETKDLILKKGDFEDWHDMYVNLWSHDESARYMLWKPVHSEEEAKERMRKNIRYMQKCDLAWFIYEKKSGQAIGFAGMEKRAENTYEDTGIAIGPAFVRKGYGKQIIMALVYEAFDSLGAAKFIGSCRTHNIASKQLFLSCGFAYTHSEDRAEPGTGAPYILDFYELTAQDFGADMHLLY